MKKFLLAAALVVASLSANAQVYLGGGVSLHSEDPGEGDTKTTINLVPELGYKLDDKLSIGVKLGYEHSKQGDKSSNDYTFEPYVRYTFAKWNKVGVFGEAGFGYTHFEDKVENEIGSATVTVKTKANKCILAFVQVFLSTLQTTSHSLQRLDGWAIQATSSMLMALRLRPTSVLI